MGVVSCLDATGCNAIRTRKCQETQSQKIKECQTHSLLGNYLLPIEIERLSHIEYAKKYAHT